MTIPEGKTIYDRYRRFLLELPELRRGAHLDQDEKLIFIDCQMLVIGWLAGNDWRVPRHWPDQLDAYPLSLLML